MRKYIQEKIYRMAEVLEVMIAALLVSVIITVGFQLALEVAQATTFNNGTEIVSDLMAKALTLAVGAEFIKMLAKHSPTTVIEVLMFAIARHMVVGHLTALETLLGVASISLLFATRKYLFCDFDEIEKSQYRGDMKVFILNKMMNLNIQCDKYETLEHFIKRELESFGEEVGVGACVYHKDYALRVARMKNNKITRVEVIRSMNATPDADHHI